MRALSARRRALVLAWVVMGCACSTPDPSPTQPETPSPSVPGAFSLRVTPNPVVFRQLYPNAVSLTLASPPPPDPRYYTASMTLMISERDGGTGHLDVVETALVSSTGVVTPVPSYDGSCDFSNEMTRSGNRAVPPRGTLAWCLGRVATPDLGAEYTLRLSPRITDGLGNVRTLAVDVPVVVQR